MHIKIKGFKVHIECDFTFVNGEMTLLKGVSGSGKSTILQAIFWALYGNMRSIYNNNKVTKNLSVTLTLPNMTVIRKKNPDVLIVNINDKSYQDAIAQSIIDKEYGNRDVWKACSYIEQKSRCALLNGTNSEKMQLLNSLSFTGENPKEYINKIQENLKTVTQTFELKQSIFLKELNDFTETLKKRPVTLILNEEDLNQLKIKYDNYITEKDMIHKYLLENEKLKGSLDYMQNERKNLINKINFLTTRPFPTIPTFKNNPSPSVFIYDDVIIPQELTVPNKLNLTVEENTSLISFPEYQKKKNLIQAKLNTLISNIAEKEKAEKEYGEINNKISQLNENIDMNKQIRKEDIWEAGKRERERDKYLQECKKLGIDYDSKIISDVLENLEKEYEKLSIFERNIGNFNNLIKAERDLDDMLSRINQQNISLSEGIITKYETQISEKSLYISELKKGLEYLTCPHCKNSVRYNNGILHFAEGNPVSLNDIQQEQRNLTDLQDKLKIMRQILNIQNNIEHLNQILSRDKINREDMINYINKKHDRRCEISDMIQRIRKIQFINIEKENTSEYLQNVYNIQQLYQRKNQLEKVLSTICDRDEITKLQLELSNLEALYLREQERANNVNLKIAENQRLEKERLFHLNRYEQEQRNVLEKRNKQEKELNIYKINEEKRYNNYLMEKEKIEQEIERRSNDLKDLKENLRNLENDISEKEKIYEIGKNWTIEYERIKEEIKRIENDMREGDYGRQCSLKNLELEKKRNEVIECQTDMVSLQKLKIKAIETECKQLEDTVNNINTVLETTLPIFFNDPITFRLLLYKINKKSGGTKPGINIEISYKGCLYDNINNLSGGEGDRISLALLLALNSVSNSPMILLDECVASLDGELKESCIEAIKRIPNKTVITVDHDDSMEGFYDSVILL
jgi:DNA repair exonuclease SbcCD ATPase subunit